MNYRRADDEDLLEISSWFSNIRWPYPPEANIGPRAGFFVAEMEGILFACAGLYATGTSKAEISWTCTNPKISTETQSRTLDQLILWIIEEAKKALPPITFFDLYTKNDLFSQRLKKLGGRIEKEFIRVTFKNGD